MDDPSESVQEIVNKDQTLIPQKFIRSEQDKIKDVDLSLQYSSQIPVIDMSLLSNFDKQELQKLDKACQDWGFFLVVNHGIPEEVVQSVKNAASGFFSLPLQEKNRYPFDATNMLGYGIPHVVTQNQTSDWVDSFSMRLFPSHYRKPELWPTTPPNFRDAMIKYGDSVSKVGKRIFRSLSLIMGMETEDALLQLHKEMYISMRINYCPTCSKPDQVLGLSPHSDPVSMTILFQDDHVTALQIRHNNGWVDIKPTPNSLVVNVGDILEIWSNGKYKSIEHRVVPNERNARISFGSFIMPDKGLEIEPLKHMVDNQKNDNKYKKVVYGDYLKDAFSRKMHSKEHLEKYKT